MTNRIQENQKFFSGEKSDIINLTDGLLKKSELDTLSSNANSSTLAKSECLKALENIGGKNFIKKLTDFRTAPGNLWDKYNACNLNNEDIAVFQFIYNLKNPDKKIDIDGQLGPKTYTALMGYKYNEKYDKSITLGILKNKFPTFDNNFLTARSSAIADRQNPFQHNGQSFYRRYDTLISCTASKEKYENTQEAKDMKEYKSIILQKTVNNIDPIKGFDTGKIYMGSDGNIVGLDYDFENATLAQQCNTVITKKMNSLLKICKDKQISLASEIPFSKIYTGSGHFQFDGIYQNGDTYEVDPVFSAEDMGGSNSILYKIMDKNEDAFLQHLNNRWNELYNKHVVDTQKNMFIPGLDINWGKNTEKVKNYLNSIVKKAEEFNRKYPTNETEPFKNDDSFDDQEIYFAGLDRVTRYEAKTGTSYTSLEKKELGAFSDAIKKQLGVVNIMNDDDNVKKVVKWLNNTWMETHVLKQVATKEEVASLISKDVLKKKLENDDDLTPKELQALQYYENQDFTKAMNDKYFGTKESYLALYTRDEGLVKGLGEKTLEHTKKIADIIVTMNPEYAVTVLQKLHAQYDDERHPDSAITILKQFTGHFGQKIYEGLTQKIQKDPKNKEKYQKQLLGLAKLVTDRNGDIDSDLKDIGLAKKIMNDLMPAVIDKSQNNKERDDQCEKKFNNNKDKVMKIFSTNPQFQKLLGNSNNLSWDSLKTFEQKQYINTLVEYVIRFGDPKNDTELQSLSPEGQAKKIVERIQALTQISMKGLMKSFTDFADAGGKYSDELQLTGFQKEVYDMYRDMMGIGKFNLSDENADTAIEYSKMAAVIVVAIAATIAVTVATGGTGTGAAVALSRSAVGSMAAGAAAGSLTGYLADYMINQRQAESNEIFMKDMFSTLAVDVATAGPFALVPGLGPLLTKYPRLANIFVKVGKTLGTKAVSGAEMITSAAVSGYAEQWRQQCIMGNEHVTFDQLVQQIGMGLAIPAIFQGGPRMLSYLRTHGELGKINSGLQKSIGYMNEMLKKNLTSEEKQLFANLKKSYVDNASQLEKMLLLENFAKQKEGEKIAIVWGTKQHTLQKVSGGEYVFVSDNGGFVKGEKVTIKEKEGKLIVTRNNGKELGITDWSLDDLNINKKSGNDSGPSIVEIVEGKGDIILDISQIDNIVLSKGHIVVIDGKKYTYNGIKNNEAVFVPKGHTGEIVVVKDAHDLLGDRFNLEPGTKTTNTGRKQKLQELLSNVDDKKDLSQSFVTPNELRLRQDNGSEEVIPFKEQSETPQEPQKVSSPSYGDQLDAAAKGIVGDLFVDVPKTSSDAMSKVEQFGIWLGKTTVGPTMKFYNDAMQWLKNIQLNFPELSLGKKINEIKKIIRESVLQERISVIDSYYSIGQEISIPRSDGSTSKGRVESFDSKTGKYKVVREESGRSYSKEINQIELDKVNVLQVDLDIPKIDQVKSKNYDKYPLVKNILENIKNNEVCKIGFDGKEVSKKKIIDGFLEARFIPNNKVDLGGGNMLFVTNQLECKGRKFIVGYTQQGDVRLFYRSGSEAEWRSTPGLRMGDYAFSKAECIENCSYETTTKCDARIGMTFDSYVIENVDINPLDKSGEIMQEMGFGKVEFNLPSMQKEVSIESMFAEFSDAVHFYQGKTVQAVQDGYKNLQIPGLDMNSMRLDPNKGYSFTHDYLGKIQVDVVKMSWKGKEIDIHFAIATDGKVFITNMVYSDAKINSFGVYNKQINAGPLTAKPVDYATKRAWQVPSDANFQRYGSYMDIRDLYQDMPLIQEYRKIKSSLNKSKGSNSEIAKADIVENIKNKPNIKEEDVYEIKAEDILTAEDIKPGDVIIDINDIDDNIYK